MTTTPGHRTPENRGGGDSMTPLPPLLTNDERIEQLEAQVERLTEVLSQVAGAYAGVGRSPWSASAGT